VCGCGDSVVNGDRIELRELEVLLVKKQPGEEEGGINPKARALKVDNTIVVVTTTSLQDMMGWDGMGIPICPYRRNE